MHDRAVTSENGGFVVPPCPSWCIVPADYDLDLDDVGARDWDGAVNRPTAR